MRLMSEGQAPTRVVAVFWLLCALSISCGSTARSTRSDWIRVRGELDRASWTLRECGTGTESRVIMPSTVAAEFLKSESDLNLLAGEVTLVEFEVTAIPTVSADDRKLGVMKVISVKRGKC